MPNPQRDHAHELIDLLGSAELPAVVGLLEVLVDGVARSIRNAGTDDEEITVETAAELDQAQASLARGEGTSHEDILREFDIAPR